MAAAMDREKLLIGLSLELMAARDPLAGVVAFGRYLQQRFAPKNSELLEYVADKFSFAKGAITHTQGTQLHVLFDLTIPKVFILDHCQGPGFSELELDSVTKLIKIFRSNLEHIIELQGLTFTDDITGLYNHRYLEIVLDREFSLATRNKSPFVVLFMDLDHFKKVNDGHGHLIGSRLLFEVGQEIKKTLRESDVTFRYGGDEFVMVLTQTNMADATMVAERIRVKIEKKRFLAREGMDIRLTASIGVAAFPEHATSKDQILKAADKALYGSKKDMRNRVVQAVLNGEVG